MFETDAHGRGLANDLRTAERHPGRPATLAVLVAVLLLVTSLAGAQDVELREGRLIVQFDEVDGTPLDDFIKLCEIQTGLQLLFDPIDTREVRLRFIGRKVIGVDQFWSYFQAVLRAHDFVVARYGNAGAPDRPLEGPDSGFYAIRRTTGGAGGLSRILHIKSQAPIVPEAELEAFRCDAGIVLTTSIALQNLNAAEVMTMLQSYFTDPQLESVRSVANSNSLVVTGFAQTLYGIQRLVRLIDTRSEELGTEFGRFELEYAVAEEVQPILAELIDAGRGQGQGGGLVAGAGDASLPPALRGPDPLVSVDPRTNSLLVVATPATLEMIADYIRVLDVEVDPRGDSHVYRLKNSAAEDIKEVLSRWADGLNGAAGGEGGAGGSQSRAAEISVVADPASNSLVITASRSRYAQTLEVVKKLDVRRRQVLIETALVEITGTLDQRLGVELGYVAQDGTGPRSANGGFGVSSFGFSELRDTDGDSIVDFRIPLGLLADSAGLPGLTAGIFSGQDFGVPLVITALRNTGDVNVLSLPSILVNDNEVAVISTTDEQPTFNVQQGLNSDQTSFKGFVEAGITLNVSPSISAGNYLRLAVELEVSTFTEPEGDPPPKAMRVIKTSVTLPDGHTMVVGGAVADDARHGADMVPWLAELPLFGWLFESSFDQSNRTNLYVFITPHIISDDFATLDDLSYVRQRELEALNGKIHLVDPDWERHGADTRILDAGASGIFDLPSYASPSAGETTTAARDAAIPADQNPVPSLYGELPTESGHGSANGE